MPPCERIPLPNTSSTGRLTALPEARRALSSCKTEMMVSLEDLEVPGHSSTSSGRKQQPWGLRAGRQGEEEEQRLPAGCALPLRGRLSSCCSRLVPCHRWSLWSWETQAEEQPAWRAGPERGQSHAGLSASRHRVRGSLQRRAEPHRLGKTVAAAPSSAVSGAL